MIDKKIRVIENFFSLELISKIHQYVVDNSPNHCWRINDMWGPDLIAGSPSIPIMDLSIFHDELIDESKKHIKEVVDFDLPFPMFYACPHNSFIGWHEDYTPINISVYLNEGWDKRYGGILLYEDPEDKKIKGIEPFFNRAVIMPKNVMHSVTPVSPVSLDRRYSIQMFYIERKNYKDE